MRLYLLFSTTLLHLSAVVANTEIVNFLASEHPAVSVNELTPDWPILTYFANEIRWDIPPAPLYTEPHHVCKDRPWYDCPHDLWLAIHLDDPQWTRFSKFTFRISWPASSPAGFHIDTFTPPQFVGLLGTINSTAFPGKHTRNLYVRVRVIDTGVPTPSNHALSPRAVPFITTLEPLYFGVLPSTLISTILALIALIFISGFIFFPRIYAYLDAIAEIARNEIRVRKD